MNVANTQGRAGRYIAQPNKGYNAFIPEPLPPKPPIQMDAELSRLLSEASLSLARLDGATRVIPRPDLFVPMFMRREAVLSCRLDGISGTLEELLLASAEPLPLAATNAEPGVAHALQAVANYIHALHDGMERMDTAPVSAHMLTKMHERLLHETPDTWAPAGQLRTVQNWFGAPGCSIQEATFVPPPAASVAPAIADLERFIHRNDGADPLILIALAYAQFETIHPFLDGNGRMGRLLLTLLLSQYNLLHLPILHLSDQLLQQQNAYQTAIAAVRNSGDWEGWLAFFLRIVSSSSATATEDIRRATSLREEHRAAIMQNLGYTVGKGCLVLDYLQQQPVLSVASLRVVTKTSFPAAGKLVSRLTELGILHEATGYRRNRIFVYRPYIDLFIHPAPAGDSIKVLPEFPSDST